MPSKCDSGWLIPGICLCLLLCFWVGKGFWDLFNPADNALTQQGPVTYQEKLDVLNLEGDQYEAAKGKFMDLYENKPRTLTEFREHLKELKDPQEFLNQLRDTALDGAKEAGEYADVMDKYGANIYDDAQWLEADARHFEAQLLNYNTKVETLLAEIKHTEPAGTLDNELDTAVDTAVDTASPLDNNTTSQLGESHWEADQIVGNALRDALDGASPDQMGVTTAAYEEALESLKNYWQELQDAGNDITHDGDEALKLKDLAKSVEDNARDILYYTRVLGPPLNSADHAAYEAVASAAKSYRTAISIQMTYGIVDVPFDIQDGQVHPLLEKNGYTVTPKADGTFDVTKTVPNDRRRLMDTLGGFSVMFIIAATIIFFLLRSLKTHKRLSKFESESENHLDTDYQQLYRVL